LSKNLLKTYFNFQIRAAKEEEFETVGKLLVDVYSELKGFPSIDQQPNYYEMLKRVGELTSNKNIELIVSATEQGEIAGAVVFYSDMKDYGSGGTATQEKNACGFRLLGVNPKYRGFGVGKSLTEFCINKGQNSDAKRMVIHTTDSMKIAWGMYEKMGFVRAGDLDFMKGDLPVYGFRLEFKK
jgi:ribosomal protein S18 acetylase RimI-like enzyme